MNVVWIEDALSKYWSVLDFWIEHNGSSKYANDIEQEVRNEEKRISENPQIGSIRIYKGIELRYRPILKNFGLFYLIDNDEVLIIDFVDNALLIKENNFYTVKNKK